MELNVALITYLVLLFLVFFGLLYFQYTVFTAWLLAVIVAFVYLNIAYPVTRDELDDVNSSTVLYIFIQILTIVFVFIYSIITCIHTRRVESKFPLLLAN